MNQQSIVTRFPPSPTGFLHIGGARTALFNWLFARRHGGKFILRIEDTDQARSTDEATDAILESMIWLGLNWDEGPYFQSKRTGLYNEAIDRLLSTGQAYHCHCPPGELERKREAAKAAGLKPKYDGTCREKGLGPAPGSVVRLKIPLTGTTLFNDLVKGPIRFNNEELDDLVLRRSDGSPTYHLAVVVDDISLGITHVIRGDDHVNNTPRQILIYQGLKEPLPLYAHVPMILGPDKTRLSKRHGAMSVMAYAEMGFLPEALLNALVRLGWSYGDQEKFTMGELVEKFSLENVGKSAGVFNPEKLLDLNAWYIRESPDEVLAEKLLPFLKKLDMAPPETGWLKKVVATLKPRSKTLVEMADAARFYFVEEVVYEEKAGEKFLQPEALPFLIALRAKLEGSPGMDQAALERVFSDLMGEMDIKLKQVAQPLRVALTGKTMSPGLFEIMEVLGKESVLKRIDRAVAHIEKKRASS
jgi:glutamyl-tRNA synthetase